MNNSLKKRLLILFAIDLIFMFLGMTTGAFTQDNEWSLKRCLEYAVENNLTIQDTRTGGVGLDNQKINSKLAKSQRYPNFSLGSSLGLNFGRTVDPTTNDFITTNFFSNGFQLNTGVSVYEGGRIKNEIKRTNADLMASEEDLNGAIINMAFDLAATYFNALLAQENVENIKFQLENSSKEIERMNRMIEVGTRAKAEIYDLEAQKATTEQDLAMSINNYDIAMVSLKAQMNIGFDIDIVLVVPDMNQNLYSDPDVQTFEEVYQRAYDFSPSNKAQKHRVKSAEYNLEVSKAGLLPTVFAGGNINTNFSNQSKEVTGFNTSTFSQPVTIDGVPAVLGTDQVNPIFTDKGYGAQIDDNLFYGFGVNINVPIYSNYQNKASVERSKVNLENMRIQEKISENNLRNRTQQLLTDARGAKRTLEASEKTLKAREIAKTNAEKRFKVGALNSYDYISIQNQNNQALINYSIAKYDYIYKIKILDYYQGYPVEF